MLRQIAATLALSLVSACAVAQDAPKPPAWSYSGGNLHMILPAECRDADALAAEFKDVSVLYIPRADFGAERWGATYVDGPRDHPRAVILLRDDLTGWRLADVIQHERCHIKWYVLTGDAWFHK